MENFDAIVLGGGAAGLMAAMTAGARGKRVVVLEHAAEVGKKILISGGGRCNFTNTGVEAGRFLSANPRFCRAALAGYGAEDFVALVRKHGIAFHEKTLGQLFCDGSARQVVRMLLDECAAAGVAVRCGVRVGEVSGGFRVTTDQGDVTAPALVVATGGLSIPKMGASGFGLELAGRFGVKVVAPRPGLVPLVFDGEEGAMMQGLAGVSLACEAAVGKVAFREAMLFTHRGLSGPAVLQASSYWEGGEVALDLLPGREAGAVLAGLKRERPRMAAHNALAEVLPARLAAALAGRHLAPRVMAEQPDRSLRSLAGVLGAWRVVPVGTEGYAKAEVMVGGVDTAALGQKDMQVKAVPGLFFVGEAVDVTGWLGGYNFQWAWSSGFAAGCAIGANR